MFGLPKSPTGVQLVQLEFFYHGAAKSLEESIEEGARRRRAGKDIKTMVRFLDTHPAWLWLAFSFASLTKRLEYWLEESEKSTGWWQWFAARRHQRLLGKKLRLEEHALEFARDRFVELVRERVRLVSENDKHTLCALAPYETEAYAKDVVDATGVWIFLFDAKDPFVKRAKLIGHVGL